jgi:transposase
MKTQRFRAQLQRIERMLRPATGPITMVACMDGKPLQVAWHSTDPHARKGRGAGGLARGYKIHAIVDAQGRPLTWRLAGMDLDERRMAQRLLRDISNTCYVVADANYNSHRVFLAASACGAQLVSPRKRSHVGTKTGHHPQHADRIRCIDLLERQPQPFARDLLIARKAVERYFGNLTNFGGGLTCLPAWVRTYPRVLAWVTAKITISHLRRERESGPVAA